MSSDATSDADLDGRSPAAEAPSFHMSTDDLRRHGHELVDWIADYLDRVETLPVGSRVRGRGEIVSVEEVKGGVQVVVRMTIEIEGSERPACVIDTISRFFP